MNANLFQRGLLFASVLEKVNSLQIDDSTRTKDVKLFPKFINCGTGDDVSRAKELGQHHSSVK